MEDRLKEKLTEYFKNNINGSHSINDKNDIVNDIIDDIIDIVKSISLLPSYLLNDIEQENAKKYIAKVKNKFGKVGSITYSFTGTGIGTVVTIKSSLKDKEKDITDYNCW